MVDRTTTGPLPGDPVRVDVIVLSWNRVDDTIAAIASADAQIGISKRIYIVDQGSDEYNLSRLRAFLDHVPCAELKELGSNAGVAGGRNIAVAMGKAPYVVALDNDAVFADPYTLARAVAHMDRNPHLCAIGFRITNYFTGENDPTAWDYPAPCRPDQRFATTRFASVAHAIRRDAFEAVGGYDDRLFFCGEELDLSYRMLNTGKRIEYVPDVEIFHKVSPQHRVFWGRGHFFFTVRNNLYMSYKFGMGFPRLAVAAGAFILKGARNRIASDTFRAISAAVEMCRSFRQSPEDKRLYRLTLETRRYIEVCEPWRKDNLVKKALRQFQLLPSQA